VHQVGDQPTMLHGQPIIKITI